MTRHLCPLRHIQCVAEGLCSRKQCKHKEEMSIKIPDTVLAGRVLPFHRQEKHLCDVWLMAVATNACSMQLFICQLTTEEKKGIDLKSAAISLQCQKVSEINK